MKKRWFWVLIVVLVVFVILELPSAQTVFKKIGEAIYPLFIGIIIALTLRSPVRFFERTLAFMKKPVKNARIIALISTLTLAIGVITLISYLIIPEIAESLNSLKDSISTFREGGLSGLVEKESELISIIDKLLDRALASVEELLPPIGSLIQTTTKTLVSWIVGIMLGITLLASQDSVRAGVYKISLYFLGERKNRIFKGSLSSAIEKFSRFIMGQLVEALIFGIVCYVVFVLFKLPYSALVAVLVAVGNLIPTIGGYIGGTLGFLVILTVNPKKALIFIIIILILQQVEQFTTYPIIVGKYVGLSSFLTLLSVVVGGGLFGFWGLILGVPIVAFLDNFIKVYIDAKQNSEIDIKDSA